MAPTDTHVTEEELAELAAARNARVQAEAARTSPDASRHLREGHAPPVWRQLRAWLRRYHSDACHVSLPPDSDGYTDAHNQRGREANESITYLTRTFAGTDVRFANMVQALLGAAHPFKRDVEIEAALLMTTEGPANDPKFIRQMVLLTRTISVGAEEAMETILQNARAQYLNLMEACREGSTPQPIAHSPPQAQGHPPANQAPTAARDAPPVHQQRNTSVDASRRAHRTTQTHGLPMPASSAAPMPAPLDDDGADEDGPAEDDQAPEASLEEEASSDLPATELAPWDAPIRDESEQFMPPTYDQPDDPDQAAKLAVKKPSLIKVSRVVLPYNTVVRGAMTRPIESWGQPVAPQRLVRKTGPDRSGVRPDALVPTVYLDPGEQESLLSAAEPPRLNAVGDYHFSNNGIQFQDF
jgi:hypothetical protein